MLACATSISGFPGHFSHVYLVKYQNQTNTTCLPPPTLSYSFSFISEHHGVRWKVTSVMTKGELGGPMERLREQMEKLQLCSSHRWLWKGFSTCRYCLQFFWFMFFGGFFDHSVFEYKSPVYTPSFSCILRSSMIYIIIAYSHSQCYHSLGMVQQNTTAEKENSLKHKMKGTFPAKCRKLTVPFTQVYVYDQRLTPNLSVTQ